MTAITESKPKNKFKSITCGSCGALREVVRGSWLRRKRESAEVSLRQIARELKLSAVYLSDVERGKRHCTRKIARHYDKRFGTS